MCYRHHRYRRLAEDGGDSLGGEDAPRQAPGDSLLNDTLERRLVDGADASATTAPANAPGPAPSVAFFHWVRGALPSRIPSGMMIASQSVVTLAAAPSLPFAPPPQPVVLRPFCVQPWWRGWVSERHEHGETQARVVVCWHPPRRCRLGTVFKQP
jgi:hypothetical protein